MLYTKSGDDGTTNLFKDKKRISKNSPVIKALGSIDELNSYLGICRTLASVNPINVKGEAGLDKLIEEVQQNLFIIQAEIGGADKKIESEKIDDMERVISNIEKILPPVKSFSLPGGTVLSALLDYARTLARKAERRVVATESEIKSGVYTLPYLNRLSTLLFSMARLVNANSDIQEKPPTY